jgi:hypothetical protein
MESLSSDRVFINHRPKKSLTILPHTKYSVSQNNQLHCVGAFTFMETTPDSPEKNKKKLGQVSLVFSLVFSICIGAFALETTPYSQITNDYTPALIAFTDEEALNFTDEEVLKSILDMAMPSSTSSTKQEFQRSEQVERPTPSIKQELLSNPIMKGMTQNPAMNGMMQNPAMNGSDPRRLPDISIR